MLVLVVSANPEYRQESGVSGYWGSFTEDRCAWIGTRADEYYRLNMPFELGLDVGSKLFKAGKWKKKKCLILVGEPYKYQAAISDLSNSDVASHGNEPEDLVVEVRNWLNSCCGLVADGPKRIWDAFTQFMGHNYDSLRARGFSARDIERLPVSELIGDMQEWVEDNT